MRAFNGFKQFFAVKALPNPAILQILLQEGCGLDCSSSAELHLAALLGVPGESVMYTSNNTSKKDLGIAFDQGVIMNLDDVSMVDHLVEIRGRCPELMCFRLNPGLGRTDSETISNVLGGPTAKFGVPPHQMVAAYRAAIAAGARRFGMHMMTGSCVMNVDYWRETVAVLVDTAAAVHRELGITFEFLNVGGGLGIPYKPEQPPVDVGEVADAIKSVLDERIAAHALPFVPRLCMENGRYMTGPFGWLVARCEAVKETYARYYGLDACMANLMRPGMYGAYHHITVPARERGPGAARAAANVVGTLCENNDWFAAGRDLPADAAVGDLFVIHDTGAHSHSMGFQYNGKTRAPELLLRENGRVELIRARENVHALFYNTKMPADLEPRAAPLPFPYTGQLAAAAGPAAYGTPTALAELEVPGLAAPPAAGALPTAVGGRGGGRAARWAKFVVVAAVVAALAFAVGRRHAQLP